MENENREKGKPTLEYDETLQNLNIFGTYQFQYSIELLGFYLYNH